MAQIVRIQLMLTLIAVAGCGGDGDGTTPAGRHVTWKDDGAAKTATLTVATKGASGTMESREILGTSPDVGVSIFVSAAAPLSAQTFDCSALTAGQTATVSYTESDGGLQLSMQTCTVNLTQVGEVGGASVVGTFTATFNLDAGGTKTITNGNFNVPVTM